MNAAKTARVQEALRQRKRAARTDLRRRFFKGVLPRETAEDPAAAARRTALMEAAATEDGRDARRPTRDGRAAAQESDRPPPPTADGDAASTQTRQPAAAVRTKVPKAQFHAPIKGHRAAKKAARMERVLSAPNRFSGALNAAKAKAHAAAAEARARAEREAAVARRRAERSKLGRAYAERTSRGQPVMAHRARDLLARVERECGGGGGGAAGGGGFGGASGGRR
jgi:hypothetical protein